MVDWRRRREKSDFHGIEIDEDEILGFDLCFFGFVVVNFKV